MHIVNAINIMPSDQLLPDCTVHAMNVCRCDLQFETSMICSVIASWCFVGIIGPCLKISNTQVDVVNSQVVVLSTGRSTGI